MNKRVLFIGYYHPDANMSGARMRRLARLLPRFGWEPVVLTHAREPDSEDRMMQGVRDKPVSRLAALLDRAAG